MKLLRQGTAVDVMVGVCVDKTDGNTVENGLTLEDSDIRISKAGGSFGDKHESSNSSNDEAGYYIVSLDTTDTDTRGILRIAFHDTEALPVWEDFMVISQQSYDELVNGTYTHKGVYDVVIEKLGALQRLLGLGRKLKSATKKVLNKI